MLWLYCKAKALLSSRDRGATAAEYALLIAFIAAVLVVTVVAFRGVIVGAFNRTCDALNDTGGATC
jgi:Flp pilus assembly pilin Flp